MAFESENMRNSIDQTRSNTKVNSISVIINVFRVLYYRTKYIFETICLKMIKLHPRCKVLENDLSAPMLQLDKLLTIIKALVL